MTKKDIALILIGTCFGMLICSIMVFFLALSDTKLTHSLTSTPSITYTPTIIRTRTSIPVSTKTMTLFPTIVESPTMTLTPTITFTSTITNTFTQTPDKRSLYKTIPNRELYTYADSYIGELATVRGMIFNINSTTELQIFAGGSSDYPMYLIFESPFFGIYEDDYITTYVVVGGMECGTNAFGGEICQPLLFVDFWEKK